MLTLPTASMLCMVSVQQTPLMVGAQHVPLRMASLGHTTAKGSHSRARLCMSSPPPPPAAPLPPWVAYVNRALESSASSTLLAFVLLDFGSASLILGALCAMRVPVGADFALALAVAKALRGPRLALDTSLAALLGRCFPALRAVRLSLLLDEFSESWAGIRRSFKEGRAEAAGTSGGFPRGFTPRPSKRAAASVAAAKLVSEHGLAYMCAKNLVGPAATLLVLAALRSGGRAQAATAWLMRTLRVTAGPAGAFAGQMALAVTLSSALFPVVVVAAAALGPMMARKESGR